jgi:uncharacterized protein (DUF1499 family)
MKTFALLLVAAIALIALALALWVRLAPLDGARWHVEPATTPDPATPNFARLEMVVPLPPADTAARLAEVAAASGAVVVAGGGEHVTFVNRSRLMAYPDYTSVRLTEVDGGTRVEALARARFGQSDLGVNRARLARWRAGLAQD